MPSHRNKTRGFLFVRTNIRLEELLTAEHECKLCSELQGEKRDSICNLLFVISAKTVTS
jgi:hypothetical protein